MLHPSGPGLFGRRSVIGVREAACLWHPPGAKRRDAPGSTHRGEGAAAHSRQGQRRRPRRRHHHGSAQEDPLSRGPAETPPPLRRPHPYGQVHAHAPHRPPQAGREGGGQGRRCHCRRRSPRRPGGRPARARAGEPGRTGCVSSTSPTSGARPASTCSTPVSSPTGTAPPIPSSASPRACGSSGDRGCSPSLSRPSRPSTRPTGAQGRGRAVHHPRRAAHSGERRLPGRGAGEGRRPLPCGVVGQRFPRLAAGDPRRRPGPGPDPPLLLRILQEGAGPSWDSPAPPSTCAASSTKAASCWSPPPRARRDETWPPWWARPSSTWWTP